MIQQQDPRSGEGIWARAVPCTTSPDRRIIPDNPPVLPLPNPSFELVGSNGLPLNWTVHPDAKGPARSGWTVDATVARTGKRSLRFDIQPGAEVSATVLSPPLTAMPRRAYQLSLFARADGRPASHLFVWVVQLDAKGNEIQGGDHLPTGVEVEGTGADEWQQQTCTFIGEPDAATFHVYAGRSENTTAPARYWIDDVVLIGLDHALSNVIQTTATDFVVRRVGVPRNSTGGIFREGIDYVFLAWA